MAVRNSCQIVQSLLATCAPADGSSSSEDQSKGSLRTSTPVFEKVQKVQGDSLQCSSSTRLKSRCTLISRRRASSKWVTTALVHLQD